MSGEESSIRLHESYLDGDRNYRALHPYNVMAALLRGGQQHHQPALGDSRLRRDLLFGLCAPAATPLGTPCA